jgi:hypothetical protein
MREHTLWETHTINIDQGKVELVWSNKGALFARNAVWLFMRRQTAISKFEPIKMGKVSETNVLT